MRTKHIETRKAQHDAFFKTMCTNKGVAIDLLKHALPPTVFKKINLKSLVLTDKTFISEELKHRESDLIYQAKLNGHAGYICFVLEHQSRPDKLMAFRKLEYNVALMRQHLQQEKNKLPVIINICLYHGDKSPYPHSTNLLDCFSDPMLAQEALFKPFRLIDLTVIPDKVIDQQGKAALMEFLFKHCKDAELSRKIKELVHFLKRVELEFYLAPMIYYLHSVCGDQDNVDCLLQRLIQELPEEEKKIMTYGEQLIQKGETKANAVWHKRMLTTAKKLLLKGLGTQEISEMTTLSLEEIRHLQGAN